MEHNEKNKNNIHIMGTPEGEEKEVLSALPTLGKMLIMTSSTLSSGCSGGALYFPS